MTEPDFQPWRDLGALLQLHREAAGLSVAKAAVMADLSESVWRQLEKGERRVGRDILPPNARTENIVRAAQAVGLDVNRALGAVGRPPVSQRIIAESTVSGGGYKNDPKALSGKIDQLTDVQRAKIEALVDEMLPNEEGA